MCQSVNIVNSEQYFSNENYVYLSYKFADVVNKHNR